MGLFDFFFGKRKPANVRNWTASGRTKPRSTAIRRELAKLPPDAVFVLLIAHFPDTLAILQQIAEGYDGPVPVRTILASQLSSDMVSHFRIDESTTIDFLVAEHHPLYSTDQKLITFAASLPCQVRVVYHQSIDDPLTKHFVGKWVEGILEKLGMKEDEPLQSAMINRRIQAAQKKLEAKTFGTTQARSAAEWFEKNLPHRQK